MPNNNSKHLNRPQPSPQLFEGLQYRDLDGMLKPTLHVDEFSSKMGDDSDVMVISFFVRDKQAAKDLVSWFEKGYDFVLDADRSPGEIYNDQTFPWSEDEFARRVPLTPDAYRAATETDLNEMRMAAGLPVKPVYRTAKDMRELQAAAGII